MNAAFAEAMIVLLPNLRRYAISLTRAPDQAEDLVQQTVERALSRADSFDPSQRLEPWLFRILRNAFIDQYRRQRSAGPQIDIHDAPDVLSTDPAAQIEARLMLRDVQAAMGELPPEQREVLHLTCIEELTYAETARVLDIPQGTVMSRLSRARIALAEKLGIK